MNSGLLNWFSQTNDSSLHHGGMIDMDEDASRATPGQMITSDPSFMRGHGTFLETGKLYASVAGQIERVNKLISVRPLKTRYIGEIGDVVIGRVVHVAQKRWTIELQAHQLASLQLSAIYLPGGVQRRKLESDELQIRSFFTEGELLSAEVQSVYQDGSMAIHTRNQRYGKLSHGTFISVSPNRIKRCKSHFHSLPCGIDLILGLNGYIWIGKHHATQSHAEDEAAQPAQPVDYSKSDHENVARVRNVIRALDRLCLQITDTMIVYAFDASLSYSVSQLLHPKVQSDVCQEALACLDQMKE